jgi:LmbE family N-acetylglucosaminyl deacetylase
MRGLRLFDDPGSPLRILALGAHADDIEIGAGGLLLELAAGRPGLEIGWIVLSGDDVRAAEARASATRLLDGQARLTVETYTFRERYFPHLPELKECFDDLGRRFDPDVVVAPRLEDRHQDHRTVAEYAWQTFRDHLVLEYEVPKYEGDLGQPNLYVPLAAATAERKVEHLLAAYPSQADRRWFSESTFRATLRLRGVESNAPSGYAEAFTARKLVAELPHGESPIQR